MGKKYIIILLIIGVIIAGIIVGVMIAGNDKTSNLQPESATKLATELRNIQNEINIITTSNVEIKTSPNCLFIFQTYYRDCGHTTKEKIDITKQDINQTEEELQEKYEDYMIQQFSANEVIFCQEKDGICNEHYILRDNNGYVAIYMVDDLGQEILKETTEILTTYLPQADLEKLKEGIVAVGEEELNAKIEDYE